MYCNVTVEVSMLIFQFRFFSNRFYVLGSAISFRFFNCHIRGIHDLCYKQSILYKLQRTVKPLKNQFFYDFYQKIGIGPRNYEWYP